MTGDKTVHVSWMTRRPESAARLMNRESSQSIVPGAPVHAVGEASYDRELFSGEQVAEKPMTAAMVTAALEATAAKIKPTDANPFRKGDAVVYPAHGVGRVERVGTEEIAGHRLDLILISFTDNQMTLRVPEAQARAAGLRKLASREDMAGALAKLTGRPKASRLMWAKRAQEYLAKINTGHPGALAEVVRDLQSADDGSGSSFSQRHLFELALDRLAGEIAVINQTTKSDAIDLLNRTLANARTDRAAEPTQSSVSA
jgi:CarD family transcriptional regulator